MAKRAEKQDDVNAGGGAGMSDEERGALVETLAEEMGELFHGYAAGDVSFEELTFEMFDTLQTLHALVTGNLTIEYYEDDYDEFEDLAGEPVDDTSDGRSRRSGRRG
jgi:hypothetical protein